MVLYSGYNTIQYNTIRVYCENPLSYNNGVLSQTEPKSGSVKACQLIYRHCANTIKLRVKVSCMKSVDGKTLVVKRLLSKMLVLLIIDFKILGNLKKKNCFQEKTVFKGIIF